MADSEDFTFTVTREDLGATITVAGDLDRVTVPHLRPVLLDVVHDAWTISLTIDVAKLTFIDSAGLGLLITSARSLRDRSGALRIINPTAAARRVFVLCGLDRTATLIDAATV